MGVEQDTHRVTLAILPEEARDSSLRTWEEWCTGTQYVNTVMTSEFPISILKRSCDLYNSICFHIIFVLTKAPPFLIQKPKPNYPYRTLMFQVNSYYPLAPAITIHKITSFLYKPVFISPKPFDLQLPLMNSH